MTWVPLTERFSTLPLVLAGPILRRVEPGTVTVWLALKEARTVTLHLYSKDAEGRLLQQFAGRHPTVRLGDHIHIVAVTARPTAGEQPLAWGGFYYYDLFFQADHASEEQMPSLSTPGILTEHPASAEALERLVYPGHPLPGFVVPPEEVNALRIMHGSCRKPHGTGKDMLAALDTLLETTIQREIGQRPHHLFLTGDQIYADDVAAPLLFALNDAGTFLFAGNQEEVLPLVNAPARTLPPGGRGPVVRNKAMFTTSTPENHLLSLAEYVAMYLFTWSDILWPSDLPAIEDLQKAYGGDGPHEKQEPYAALVSRLRQFRSTLPHVRRALAHIPLYTICDDHDVTDDWYLDGAWCQQVLHSELGHRILRNALLAYALFHAWGNTPDQFEQPNGKAFLAALDTWRGDEADDRAKTLSIGIGLPDTFAGRGELPQTEQAFDWHYRYAGSRYQVIVMDTRTQRLYRSPSAFPGLLSPHALETQVAAAIREDADVTIMISATPAIGQNFVEAVQFWGHWSLRNNYALDQESWALDWGTFQPFLKTVSAMKRVVFLSGDVHYAFGSSLAYWSLGEHTTAKMVNYTSSPLLNEVSGPEIAVLITIYPQLAHLLRGQGSSQADFFAWDIEGANRHLLKRILPIILRRLYFVWWSVPMLMNARRSRTEIVFPARGWPRGAFNAIPPDRRYRVHYLRDQLDIAQAQEGKENKPAYSPFPGWLLRIIRLGLKGVTILEKRVEQVRKRMARRARGLEQESSHVRNHVLRRAIRGTDLLERKLEKRKNTLGEAIFHHQQWLQEWKAGSQIIGYANIGEISFHWNTEEQEVVQRLWWWHPSNPEHPTLASEFHETLRPPALDAGPQLP